MLFNSPPGDQDPHGVANGTFTSMPGTGDCRAGMVRGWVEAGAKGRGMGGLRAGTGAEPGRGWAGPEYLLWVQSQAPSKAFSS